MEFVKQHIDMLKQIINISKITIETLSSYIEHLDPNNLYGWAMSQKLPVNGFNWVKQEELSNFNEDFIKKYDKNSDKGYFLEVDIDYLKELVNLHED